MIDTRELRQDILKIAQKCNLDFDIEFRSGPIDIAKCIDDTNPIISVSVELKGKKKPHLTSNFNFFSWGEY